MALSTFESQVTLFEEHFFALESNSYDPEGVHHEFNQGLHGIKIDFDSALEGTALYDEWVAVTAADLDLRYSKSLLGRAVLIGVANGTNRLARHVATALDCGAVALETQKLDKGIIKLTPDSIAALHDIDPELAIITEDIATRGTNGASVVLSTLLHAPPSLRRVEVSHTVERGVPEKLLELSVPYHSLIIRAMQNYTPEECYNNGYCAAGWKLIPYGQ